MHMYMYVCIEVCNESLLTSLNLQSCSKDVSAVVPHSIVQCTPALLILLVQLFTLLFAWNAIIL